MASYIAVFEYTPEAGAYAGNRFISYFRDRDEYANQCTSEWLTKSNLKIVEDGISQCRAHTLCDEVSLFRKAEATLAEYCGDTELAMLALAVELKT